MPTGTESQRCEHGLVGRRRLGHFAKHPVADAQAARFEKIAPASGLGECCAPPGGGPGSRPKPVGRSDHRCRAGDTRIREPRVCDGSARVPPGRATSGRPAPKTSTRRQSRPARASLWRRDRVTPARDAVGNRAGGTYARTPRPSAHRRARRRHASESGHRRKLSHSCGLLSISIHEWTDRQMRSSRSPAGDSRETVSLPAGRRVANVQAHHPTIITPWHQITRLFIGTTMALRPWAWAHAIGSRPCSRDRCEASR